MLSAVGRLSLKLCPVELVVLSAVGRLSLKLCPVELVVLSSVGRLSLICVLCRAGCAVCCREVVPNLCPL